MFLFLCLLCLTPFLGVMSQTLTQSSAETKKPGQSVKMSCVGHGFQIASTYIHWVQQIPGGGLTWIGRIDPDNGATDYSSSYQGRFTMTSDKSANTAFLQIDNLKVEDTATYYCARGDSSNYFDIWGPGTFVTVTSAEKASPSVYPLSPCCNSASTLPEVTIGCLSTSYLPEPVDVTWNSGSISTGIKNLPAILKDGSFMSTSLLTIPTSEWKSKKYTCTVEHKPSGSNQNKDVQGCKSDVQVQSSPFTVKVMQSSCYTNNSVDLVCLISGQSTDVTNIDWLQDEKKIPTSSVKGPIYKDTQGNVIFTSKLNVPKYEWDAGYKYTCKVHSANSKPSENKIGKCVEPRTLIPKVMLFHPSPKNLVIIKKYASLTCVVSQLPSTTSLKIQWTRSDGEKSESSTSEPHQEFDGTYTVKSYLNVTVKDWESPKEFTCIVEHDLLNHPKRVIGKQNEESGQPHIYIFYTSEEHSTDVDIICFLKNFTPENIYVQWKKNEESIKEEMYINTKPIVDDNNETYNMYSRLRVPKDEWNTGATYTCSGVLKGITSKDIKKPSGK